MAQTKATAAAAREKGSEWQQERPTQSLIGVQLVNYECKKYFPTKMVGRIE